MVDNTSAQSEFYRPLKALSNSELYDHLEGGFYNKNPIVDGKFNQTKSLSNNAHIIDIFLAASGIFIDTTFSVPTINSLQWLINNLQSSEGFFFLEMEDENIRSNYYLLSHQHIKQQLDDDTYQVFMSAYNLQNNNFKDAQPLKRHRDFQQISEQTGHHLKHIPLVLESAHQQLISLRKQQLSPPITLTFDLKSNANIISSLYVAASLFNRDDFALAADRALDNISKRFTDSKSLTTNLIDYQWLIQALLKCLTYQWSDERFQWLLILTLEMIQDPCFVDSILSDTHSESIINNLNTLYILSSQKIFLNTAQLLYKKLTSRLDESTLINADLLLTLAATTMKPKVVIIRGQNFQVTHWQQQISSGFVPQQFIFPVGNKFIGPDPKKYPITPSVIAYNPRLDSSIVTIVTIDTVDELLSCCP
ncbi:MAG: hypothetical protein ACI9IA_002453 [Enterobacterales bacterium]|jgi:uncharacterized protein YyaL (SSP411 family)